MASPLRPLLVSRPRLITLTRVWRVFKLPEDWEEQGNEEKREEKLLWARSHGQDPESAKKVAQPARREHHQENTKRRHTVCSKGSSLGHLPNLHGPGTNSANSSVQQLMLLHPSLIYTSRRGFILSIIMLWRDRDVCCILARLASLFFNMAVTVKVVFLKGCDHTSELARLSAL